MACYEALITQKFLLCISLRAGTLIILWWSFFFSVGAYILCHSIFSDLSNKFSNSNGRNFNSDKTGLTLLSMIFSALWMFFSGKALYFMPATGDTEYLWMGCIKVDKTKHLRSFARFNIAVIIFYVLMLFLVGGTLSSSEPDVTAFRENYNLDFDKFFKLTIFVSLLSGMHLHFAAVIYSYYRSII